MAAMTRVVMLGLVLAAFTLAACNPKPPSDRVRASGYVEATEVQVSTEVGGRLLELAVTEGARVDAGAVVARLDSRDTELTLQRARAERRQADAQRRLLEAGARPEEIRQAEAQRDAAVAEVATAREELKAAERDLERFEALLASSSGSRKQRDDAMTRRDVARERVRAADERVRSAAEVVARLRAGPRRQEVEVAIARVAAVDAQIAAIEKALADAIVRSPISGIVSQKLANVGELVKQATPLIVVADLDHAWANVYVGEPDIPRIKLGQPATLFTDAGGPGMAGTITFIASNAEFTPRNVQTAEERSKLVYRLKVSVDNRQGVLKQGMPVEAEIQFSSSANGQN